MLEVSKFLALTWRMYSIDAFTVPKFPRQGLNSPPHRRQRSTAEPDAPSGRASGIRHSDIKPQTINGTARAITASRKYLSRDMSGTSSRCEDYRMFALLMHPRRFALVASGPLCLSTHLRLSTDRAPPDRHLSFAHIAEREVSDYTGANDVSPFSKGSAMATGPTLTSSLPAAQEWKDMLEEILPPQGRWSEEEYLLLTDHRNRLIEFTDGFLEPLPMPTDKHQSDSGVPVPGFSRFIDQAGRSAFRRCGSEFGPASSASPICYCCFPPPIRAGRTVLAGCRPRPGSGERREAGARSGR